MVGLAMMNVRIADGKMNYKSHIKFLFLFKFCPPPPHPFPRTVIHFLCCMKFAKSPRNFACGAVFLSTKKRIADATVKVIQEFFVTSSTKKHQPPKNYFLNVIESSLLALA
jgi:hypothetical protein